ncbi:tetratricopeptide repeat protein [Pendulispora rubella]|uniref:Tetratricopeptide repeat protein n=1 Tax=Pendulispora rubella TaxID=2741070 RepID=A0ABZ2LDF5_9BACT
MRAHRAIFLALAGASFVVACSWDPTKPFEREAPAVREAISALDAGDASAAASTLQEYLSTGQCESGNIGTPTFLKQRPNGSFDLGLSLFHIGEAFGGRFGDEEADGGKPSPQRDAQIDCALRIVRAVAEDETAPIDLRARARYLEGNLLFLGGRYEGAVTAYNQALTLAPGQVDAGDPVGRDAAWNRAIALRRIEDKKDSGPPDGGGDSGDSKDPDGGNNPPDSGPPDSGPPDGGGDSGKDGGGDSGNPNQGNDGGGGDSGGPDASPNPPPQPPDAGAPPPPSNQDQDDRILDQLEKAPTVQQEAAKKIPRRARMRGGMEDK